MLYLCLSAQIGWSSQTLKCSCKCSKASCKGLALSWTTEQCLLNTERKQLCHNSHKLVPLFKHLSLDLSLPFCYSYAGDVEINVEIKKYFCKAGVKGVQVREESLGHSHIAAVIKWPENTFSESNFLFAAPWDAACDPWASDWKRTAGWSCHNVLHSQACECFFCLMTLHFAVMQGLLLIHVYLSVSYV